MEKDGFSFIEIILVIVIMGIVVPTLIWAVSYITQSQVNPIGTTVATTLAQEEMECLIAQKRSACAGCGYENTVPKPIPNKTPTQCDPSSPALGTFTQMGAPFSNYWKKIDAEYVDASLATSGTDQGYKKITVTVQARGVGPSVPDAVLVTVLTRY